MTVKIAFSPDARKVVKETEEIKVVKSGKRAKAAKDVVKNDVVDVDIASSLIKKPLLAETLEDVAKVPFPCLVTPKIDGIRALRIGKTMVSRQFKPIRNRTMRNLLSQLLPEGSDGEIIVDGTFQDVTSKVMSISAGIDFKEPFTYYWFDYVKDDPNKPYDKRLEDIRNYVEHNTDILCHSQAKIIPLYPKEINNKEELLSYEERVLAENFEGVMVREPTGKYKMGRSTLKEGILLKLKRFVDTEAMVISVHELYHNENVKEKNELGFSKRSSKKEGLIPATKLGSLEVVNDAGEKFHIGTGFTDQMRQDFWNDADNLIGKIVKYKYFKTGSKNAPRFPTFVGFRDEDDM